MDDPNITIEEYIQLEAEKARRHGQEFNWEIATCGKVRYFEDISCFKDFKNEFPTSVYKVALTSELEVSSKPTVSACHVKKVNFDFEISFDESDDEDYTFTYDKNSFSYKLIYVDDLKLDSDKDDDKIDMKYSSEDLSIEPLPNVDETSEVWRTALRIPRGEQGWSHGVVEGVIGNGKEVPMECAPTSQRSLTNNSEPLTRHVGSVNGNRVGCLYKEFLACSPKEYDGKGGVVVHTRWIKKMESVHDMSGCSIDQKVKYTAGLFVELCPSHEMQKLEFELWNHAMVGAGHATYTDRFHELVRLVPHLVTPESRMIERYVYDLAPQICGMVSATEPKTIQKAVQISGALTDDAVRNGSIKKVEKRGNVGEPSKDRSGKDDNKRTRTVNAFATTVNPVGR
ncbi:hypothetical protein Tco_0531375 [Tanacetum coccineum]